MNSRLSLRLLLISFLSLITAHSYGMITTQYLYNNSNKPWSLFFLMKLGDVGTNYPFKNSLLVKLDPGQVQPIYYEDQPIRNCGLEGKVNVSDFENKSYCYKIDCAGLGRAPYIRHKGVTGPVVLNGSKPGSSEYGSLMFIGDFWSSWHGRVAPHFGSTC